MPRDLESMRSSLEGMEPLTKDPEAGNSTDDPPPLYVPTLQVSDEYKKLQDLHPYSSLLNMEDVGECDWLENTAFEPHEAASREKRLNTHPCPPHVSLRFFLAISKLSIPTACTPSPHFLCILILGSMWSPQHLKPCGSKSSDMPQLEYRLTVAGDLASGLYTSAYATTEGPLGELVRSRSFPSVDSSDSDRKKVLLGHIVATKHHSRLVTDDAMAVPSDWRSNYQISPPVGHDEAGETVCLHSLAVHPDFHGRGLGRVLLRGWCQRMRDADCSKRIALICRERLIPFYEKAGFLKVGPSPCQFGGGGWFDMVLEFNQMPKDSD
ncbi:acyl-CoA N-acyltransferase [Delitschia confertaspora ATCC 74209]|uniref:Acyl-CoA N-acyltransferase n=1 Tax=Delitschia confertaspora ATCC 74209 TaxID=1513339 RepID=A0A9P4JP81_9PLEO|nr:acyl-CoA N-acyltransferase [Delitschia confertaspora ATCC 74209]